MEKYKVCPSCGEHNNPIFIECSNCGTDLMSVKVVDEATENITYDVESEAPMVKICECGAENPPAARKCGACDEDISDINIKLNLIKERIKERPEVAIIYFQPDERKQGGAYLSVTGNVRWIDEVNCIIVFDDERNLDIKAIIDLRIL